jgi:TPP-dependent pyruvate/acetoin dehydrogenase alpha subunit
MYDAELYRDKSEVAQWKQKDPLLTFRSKLEAAGMWDQLDAEGIEKEVGAITEEAVAFAENGTLEPLETLTRYVYATEVENG